uniref:Uncharacterized protein n=1 Tax=Anguilla anguilla TaxID=7936 RepID=A0A0E9TI83_ANGAN
MEGGGEEWRSGSTEVFTVEESE